jgi:MFS family permease
LSSNELSADQGHETHAVVDPSGSAMNERRGSTREWFTPGVRGIGLASLLSDLGHEIPTALLPRFVTTTLGGSAAALGVIEGISDGVAGVARLAGGALADDPGRRRATAVGGYTSTAVLSGLMGVATSIWQVGVLRAGAWAARGLRVPSRNALLADAVAPETYGRAYGYERTMDNLGAIGGPLVAVALLAIFSLRTTFVLSIVPGLMAAAAIVYAIAKLPRLERRDRQPLRLQVRPVLQGGLGRLMFAAGAFELGNAAATLLILRTTSVLSPDRGLTRATTIALLLYTAYNAAAAIVSLPAGHTNDRLGSVPVWAVGAAAFLGAYTVFAWGAVSVPALGVAFVLAGIGIGCAETAQSAAVASAAGADFRGSAFGLLAGIQAFGNLGASAIAGIVWTTVSPRAAFLYLGAWMLVTVVILARTISTERGPAQAVTG